MPALAMRNWRLASNCAARKTAILPCSNYGDLPLMLYQIYETQRSLMEPFADFAQAASKLYSNPLSPLGQSQVAHRISATYDLIYRQIGRAHV